MVRIENIIILQNKVDLIKSEVAMKHYGRANLEFLDGQRKRS
jgi:translation initiation factor 2 gamma subunit (eIF-2gamma)